MYGNTSHSYGVAGPKRVAENDTGSAHGERNTWLKYGNSGLP